MDAVTTTIPRRSCARRLAVASAAVAACAAGVLPFTTARALSTSAVPAQQAQLNPVGASSGDAAGQAVSLSADGNTALVGAPDASPGGQSQAGAVYVFTRNGSVWTQRTVLTASSPTAGDNFGWSVAVDTDGDTALIGAPADTGSGVGSAYVFQGSGATWTQQAILSDTNGGELGYSVSLRGGAIALAGAPFQNGGAGAVDVWTQSGSAWNLQTTLTSASASAGDEFGWSVAFAGNTAVIGAPGTAFSANDGQGAAYVFTSSGGVWTQQIELTSDDGGAGDNFGSSVAFGGGTRALIGAPFAGSGAGAAYVFTGSGSTWDQTVELLATNGQFGDEFGRSVAFGGGNSAFVGAPQRNGGVGAAFLFLGPPKSWAQVAEITATSTSAEFGNSVSINSTGRLMLAGAPQDSGTGEAYAFSR